MKEQAGDNREAEPMDSPRQQATKDTRPVVFWTTGLNEMENRHRLVGEPGTTLVFELENL